MTISFTTARAAVAATVLGLLVGCGDDKPTPASGVTVSKPPVVDTPQNTKAGKKAPPASMGDMTAP